MLARVREIPCGLPEVRTFQLDPEEAPTFFECYNAFRSDAGERR